MTHHSTEPGGGPRIRGMGDRLANLWRPAGLAEQIDAAWPGRSAGEAGVIFWRGRMLTSILYLLILPFILAVLILWLTGRRSLFLLLLLATMSVLNSLVTHALRLWFLFRLGGWTRRDGGAVRRSEQPARFWTWAAVSSGMLAIWAAVAGYMVWMLVSPP